MGNRTTRLPPSGTFYGLPLSANPLTFWIEGLDVTPNAPATISFVVDTDEDWRVDGTDSVNVTVIGQKIPLGASVASKADRGHFRVYMPTKWGGKLNVQTTAGTISDLKYPDGTSYANNTETGEDKHGWYTFKVTGSTNYTVSASFLQEGEATKRPWNFYWWAAKGDFIYDDGNAIADTTAVGDDIQVLPVGAPAPDGADVVRSGPNGTLETIAAGDDIMVPMINLFDNAGPYQPLVKYDARHGTNARDWEAANGQGSFDWCGHCLGCSMASILLKQPEPAPGSMYGRDELEGLWCELGEDGYIYTVPHFVQDIPPGPPVPGNDSTDTKMDEFHKLLEQWINNAHVALYSNLRCVDCQKTCWGGSNDGNICITDADCPGGGSCKTEVWNHAVYEFSATYEEAPGGNEKIVRITNTLFANADHGPPTDDTDDRQVEYVYVVEYDSIGEPKPSGASDFISVSGAARYAPQCLYHVTAAAWGGANPHVSESDVKGDDNSN